MKITIFTDASYKNGIGSWAIHLTCEKGKIRASGTIGKVKTNNIAEMLAIKEGINLALFNWEETQEFIIHTDSLMCCHMFWKHIKGGSKDKQMRQLKQEILDLCDGRDLTVKYVKAHNNNSDTRNDWCDREAKTIL